jgi:hypothetical protein
MGTCVLVSGVTTKAQSSRALLSKQRTNFSLVYALMLLCCYIRTFDVQMCESSSRSSSIAKSWSIKNECQEGLPSSSFTIGLFSEISHCSMLPCVCSHSYFAQLMVSSSCWISHLIASLNVVRRKAIRLLYSLEQTKATCRLHRALDWRVDYGVDSSMEQDLIETGVYFHAAAFHKGRNAIIEYENLQPIVSYLCYLKYLFRARVQLQIRRSLSPAIRKHCSPQPINTRD